MPKKSLRDALSAALAPAGTPAASNAATPPGPSLDLDTLDSLRSLAAADQNPVSAPAAEAARSTVDLQADAQRMAVRAGLVVSAPNAEPFDPPTGGVRDYLFRATSGRLDLPAFRDTDLASRSLVDAGLWLAKNPGMARRVLGDGDTRAAFFRHAQAISAVYSTPPSPRERSDIWLDLFDDWSASAKAGKLNMGSAGAGAVAIPQPKLDAVPRGLVKDIVAKTIHGDRFSLDRSTLTPEERAAFDALGGDAFLDFVRSHERAYVVRDRISKFLGRPLRDPRQVYDIDASTTFTKKGAAEPGPNAPPSTADFDIGPFVESSPFLTALAQDATARAGAAATAEAAAMGDRGVVSAGLRDIAKNVKSGAVRGQIAEGLEWAWVRAPMYAATVLTGGLLPQAVEAVVGTVDAIPVPDALRHSAAFALGHKADDANLPRWVEHGNTLGQLWSQVWSSFGRFQAQAAGTDDAAVLSAVLDAFPNAGRDSRQDLVRNLFNTQSAVRDLLANVSTTAKGSFVLSFPVNSILGLDNPGVRARYSTVANNLVGLESPGAFLLTAVGFHHLSKAGRLRSIAKHAERQRLKTFKNLFSPEELQAIEGAPPAVSLAEHAVLTDNLNLHLSTLDDPTLARGIARRLERKLADVPGLTAEDSAAAKAAVDRIKSATSRLPDGIAPDVRESLVALGKPISHLGFLDQARVMLGDEGRARSAAFVAAAENWLRLQAETPSALPNPFRKFSKVEHATRGALLAAERERFFGARRDRLVDLTDLVTQQVSHEIRDLTTQRDTLRQHSVELARSWNDYLSEATDNFVRLETGGGEIQVPKPTLRSPTYKKLKEALSTKDPNALLGVTNDQRVIEAIQTPEFRDTWTELRAELDVARGKAPAPDATAVALKTTIDKTAARIDQIDGEIRILEEELARLPRPYTAEPLDTPGARLRAEPWPGAKGLGQYQRQLEGPQLPAPEGAAAAADVPARRGTNVPAAPLSGAVGDVVSQAIDTDFTLLQQYADAVYRRDVARKQIRSLRDERVEAGTPRARQDLIGHWQSELAKAEAEIKDLRSKIPTGATKAPPKTIEIEARRRSLTRQIRTLTTERGSANEVLFNSQSALSRLAADTPPVPRPEPEILQDMARTFGERALAWLDEQLVPDTKPVPAAAAPRLKLAESIRQRLATAGDEALLLSPDELAALNEYRSTPITQPRSSVVAALRRRADEFDAEARRLTGVVDEAAKLRQTLDTLTSDTQKLPISPELKAAMRDRLRVFDDVATKRRLASDTPGAIKAAFDQEPSVFDGHFVSLLDELSPDGISALDAFDEALSGLREEHQLLMSSVIPLSSHEMTLLLQSGKKGQVGAILSAARESATGIANLARYEALHWNRVLQKTLTPAQRQQILRDIATGKPTSPEARVIMDRQRRYLLDELLKTGAISPEFFHSLLKQNYYHGTYSRALRAQLADAAAKTPAPRYKLPSRFEELFVDSDYFSFKIPEEAGGFYVVWEDAKRTIRHKTGFTSPNEAEAFLSTLPSDVHKATIRRNIPFDEKLLLGQITDVGTSHLTLVGKLAHHLAMHRLTGALRHSGLVKSALDFGPDAGASVVDASGARWYRVDNHRLPNLHGTYMHEMGERFLDDVFETATHLTDISRVNGEFVRSTAESLDAATRVADKLRAGAATALRTSWNTLALGQIALTHTAYTTGILTNLFQSWTAGVPFTPAGIYSRLRYIRTYLQLRKAGRTDPILAEGIKRNSIIPDSSVHGTISTKAGWDDILKATDEAGFSSLEGIRGRIETVERNIAEAKAAGNLEGAAAFHAHLVQLQDLLGEKARAAHTGTFRRLAAAVDETVRGTFDHIRSGKASPKSLLPKIWHFYQEASLDNPMKYAVAKYLVEERGYSVGAAWDMVESRMQHLHRTPQRLKNAVGQFGGALFVSYPLEQIRTTLNILREDPLVLARFLALQATWNTTTLAAEGEGPAYLQTWAADRGWQRTGVTDTMALLSGFHMPLMSDTMRGHWTLPTGGFLYDVLRPQSAFGRGAAASLLGAGQRRERAGLGQQLLDVPVSALIGLLSKALVGEPGIQTLVALQNGQTPDGKPIDSAWRAISWLLQQHLPAYTPVVGRDSGAIARLAAGKEVDPGTHRAIGVFEYLARRNLRLVREAGDDQALAAAIRLTEAASGRLADYRSSMAYDELRSVLVARKALGPDGKVDPTKARPIIEEWYQEHGAELPGLPGDPNVPQVISEATIVRAMEQASMPSRIARFSRLSADDAVAAYLNYRAMRSGPTPQDGLLEQVITRKLMSASPAQRDTLETLANRLGPAYLNRSDVLDPATLQRLNGWIGQARLALLPASFK